MGAKGKNFYNDLAKRYGYEAEAEEIQSSTWRATRTKRRMKVPGALIDEVALVGPKARVKERLSPLAQQPSHHPEPDSL